MHPKRYLLLLPLAFTCCKCKPIAGEPTSLVIQNERPEEIKTYVAFGSDSTITAADWNFCGQDSGLNCTFTLKPMEWKPVPSDKYLNATISFDNPVGCGVTKSEVNINNPSWYDILDVSLVDGFSNKVQIEAESDSKTDTLGPALDESSDAQLMGVFPFGCDICVERQDPPCGIAKGKTGCKAGTQYDPDPPCQWQGAKKGGGDLIVTVKLLAQ